MECCVFAGLENKGYKVSQGRPFSLVKCEMQYKIQESFKVVIELIFFFFDLRDNFIHLVPKED